jgi:hypothetical protein
MLDRSKIKVAKIDAAQRQLQTAIRLWFNDGDAVSIHTLAFAAYEVIHVISKKQKPDRRDLLFDSLIVKDEYRADWNKSIKEHANFFKHAKNDFDASIDFAPVISVLFMMSAITGIGILGRPHTAEETALTFWLFIHEPDWIKPAFRQRFADRVPVEDFAHVKTVEKTEFLEAMQMVLQK